MAYKSIAPASEPAPVGWRDVIAERQRQISAEGWTPEHDDAHGNGEIACAASCYAYQAAVPAITLPWRWPWSAHWWKPTNRRRDLVKAGALILAEIERLDRLPAAPEPECSCPNCEWEGSVDELSPIKDIFQRVAPGEIMPAGECPECGVLVHSKSSTDE